MVITIANRHAFASWKNNPKELAQCFCAMEERTGRCNPTVLSQIRKEMRMQNVVLESQWLRLFVFLDLKLIVRSQVVHQLIELRLYRTKCVRKFGFQLVVDSGELLAFRHSNVLRRFIVIGIQNEISIFIEFGEVQLVDQSEENNSDFVFNLAYWAIIQLTSSSSSLSSSAILGDLNDRFRLVRADRLPVRSAV